MCGSPSTQHASSLTTAQELCLCQPTAACVRALSLCYCRSIMVAFKGIWTKDFWRAVSGEYLATLVFVLLGLGSTIRWDAGQENPAPADLVLVSLCFGLSVATMVQCFGHISGGHINPAVTAAMVVTGKLSLAKGLFYVAAQCLGAISGAGVLCMVTPTTLQGALGVTMVNPKIAIGPALLVELLITFELVFTVFATCDPKRTDLKGSAGLAIGFAVAIGHLFAIPFTGASMNPARSFGPAVVTLNFQNHWVYWVGPVLGGVLAAALYEYLYCPNATLKERIRQVFRTNHAGKYNEVEVTVYPEEPDEGLIKSGSVHATGAERRDPYGTARGEVLASV